MTAPEVCHSVFLRRNTVKLPQALLPTHVASFEAYLGRCAPSPTEMCQPRLRSLAYLGPAACGVLHQPFGLGSGRRVPRARGTIIAKTKGGIHGSGATLDTANDRLRSGPSSAISPLTGDHKNVAKSSISADITAANSKMAQHIRAQEEREGLGIGRARVRDVAAENQGRPVSKGKSSRWSLAADFASPSPMVDRPRTTNGSTSFHFSYTSISKQGSPTFNGTPVSTGSFSSPAPGADHEKYIGREGAAEYSMGADHAAYIERDGAIEMMDRTGEMAEGMERSLADMVNEVPSEEDAKLLGPEDVREGIPSIFSNISDNPFEREEYWRAVHRTEREPKKHQLLVDPSVNPTWWAQMEGWPDMNEAFRAHCLMEKARYRQWQRDERKESSEKQFQPKPFQEDAEIIGRALVGARKTPGWNEVDPPVTFKSGRGGRVQFRFVAELPHEVSPEDRALIVQNFCDHLATFSEGPDGRPAGMMYTAVIHAPDAHNDRRNYHLHVIAHDRPAKWMPEHGAWDFEVAEVYQDPGSRKDRTRFPYRQNKIGEVSQGESKTNRKGSGIDFVPAMRQRYSEIANAVLNLRGVDRRLDPRRYAEMGIERTPTKHLGTSAAALESIGVATELGKENAAAIWNDAARAIERRAKDVDAALGTQQRELVQMADDVQRTDPRNPALQTLRILAAERESLIENVADDRRLIMTFDHLEAKAKSRAIRTRQTCLQFLTDIQHGVADRTTNSSVRQIQQRWREAQDHIEAIDRDLAPQRPVLASAAQDVIVREERIKQIDALLIPIRAALENAAQQARDEREQKLKRRDRAKDLGRRDDTQESRARERAEAAAAAANATADPARSDAAGGSSTTQAGTPQGPATATDQPAAPAGRTNLNTNDAKENVNVRTEGDRPAILRTGWIEFAPPESGPAGAGSLSAAASLAGLRDLSGVQLVHDGDGSEVLLQRLPSVVLERQGGGGDVVRRARDGDPSADGQDGEGRGLTPTSAPSSQAASMQPIAIEGVPITAPTIDPASSPIASPAELAARVADVAAEASVPGGLTPLRPQTTSSVPATPDEPTVSIDDAVTTTVPVREADLAADGSATSPVEGKGVSSPEGTVSSGEDPKTDPATKVDGRRRVEEATLFPLETQLPPEKPGTVRAEYSTWNDLMSRISSERVLVIQTSDRNGRTVYDVPSLDDQERAALRTDRFTTRTSARLAAIHQSQQREIDRLVRWIAKNGRDPEQLTIVDRRARIGDAPQSVHRLMRDWGIHPDVTQALRGENERRVAEARDAAIREAARAGDRTEKVVVEKVAVRDEAIERNERMAELQRRYPDPSGAHTMQVEELLKMLREDADRREIERAAEAVRQDAAAREDVHRHGLELSQAYNTILDEAGAGFGLGAGRGKRGGR
jgi:hypothetical protein